MNILTKRAHASSPYRQSPKEIAARKKARELAAGKKAKFDHVLTEAINKVKCPLSEKHLDALLDLTLYHMSTAFQ